MSDGYRVWDDLGQHYLIVEYLADLGPVVALEPGTRVYETDTGQLLERNPEAEDGWTVVRDEPRQVITPVEDQPFSVRKQWTL